MKIIKNISIAVLLLLVSCKGMNDNIAEYLDSGEINYIGCPDSASVFGGKERLLLKWRVNADPRIEFCTLSWNDLNNEPQSETFPVDRNSLENDSLGNEYMSIPMSMPEGSFIFKLMHTGSKGYPSVAVEVPGRVYGERYQSTLNPRTIEEVVAFSDRAEITWGPADNGVTRMEITYGLATGGTRTIEAPADEEITILPDLQIGGEYSWITYYRPEPFALDEFSVVSRTETVPITSYPLSKTGWTATAPTDHYWGQGPGAVIDNNYQTYWHSAMTYSADDPVRPYYVEIDMKDVKPVISITVEKRYQVITAEIRASVNNVQWTILGQLTYPDGGANEHGTKTLELDEYTPMRYIRVYIIESSLDNTGGGSFFEIDVTGYD
jgi:hypothetical protein